MITYQRILYCTDFSEDADIAMLHALDLAKRHGGKLYLFHVPHSSYAYCRHVVNEHVPSRAEGGEAFFDQEVEKLALKALRDAYEERLGDFENYEFVVRSGAPDIEIIRFARKHRIDVIVMGALGKSEQERVEHGSTVANVSKYAHCHVIAIRNPAKRFTLPGQMYS